MTKLRFRVGSYETELTEEQFTADLKAFLEDRGTISEVENRGLLVSIINQQGRPGNISKQIVALLIKNPGLSRAKMFRRLPDLTPHQIESGVARLVKNKELVGTRSNKGTGSKYYSVYTVTELGEQKFYENEVADERAKEHALAIWAAWRTLGYRDGSGVDYQKTREVAKLSMAQMKAGMRFLREKDKVSISGRTDDGHSQYWVKK